MGKNLSGKLLAQGLKFVVIVSRFNEFITSKLLSGAQDSLVRHGASKEDIDVIWTPGAWEIPAVAARVVEQKRYDAVICLGCVIRGGTPHFEYVAAEVSKGLANLALSSPVPVAFGILTTDTIEQAIERAGSKSGNKGEQAALSAIEMANLYREIK